MTVLPGSDILVAPVLTAGTQRRIPPACGRVDRPRPMGASTTGRSGPEARTVEPLPCTCKEGRHPSQQATRPDLGGSLAESHRGAMEIPPPFGRLNDLHLAAHGQKAVDDPPRRDDEISSRQRGELPTRHSCDLASGRRTAFRWTEGPDEITGYIAAGEKTVLLPEDGSRCSFVNLGDNWKEITLELLRQLRFLDWLALSRIGVKLPGRCGSMFRCREIAPTRCRCSHTYMDRREDRGRT